MNQFSRILTGWRFVETLANDKMQGIAARELGDASRWVDPQCNRLEHASHPL